ncbi:MAG: hypothetical protein B7Z73_04390 [Planctomycetia bacterium 21-64-5]|nr:MAG: hypothetical protein B7Z73_04390 [Planctomycetia bacterium 21-64-5]HQU45938.1 DUF1570 domain-containing protein [Pirellulales bacterium]
MRLCLFLISISLACPHFAAAVEHVVLRQNGEEVSVAGRLLVTAEDDGMLLLSADGSLWTVPPEELVRHKHDDQPMTPLSSEQLAVRLRRELPGFDIHVTQHYLICHNTSRAYAQWCGALFERLYKAFTNFWSRKDFDLREPEFPLVAVVFADQPSYAAYAGKELGDAVNAIIGYYSLRSNRMTMYDLTGVEALRRAGDKRSSAAQINQMLARPEAERTVATIIHEATHQIAFNCGLQTRYADIPLWLSEGVAIYFETPDLTNSKGWRTIGSVNQVRLAGFREYLARPRPADSLATLVSSDERLRDPKQSGDAYAEAWALNYFLIRQRPKQYLAYVKTLSEKKQLIWDDADSRLREFTQAFGDLKQLDAEFVRQMAKVR